MRAWTVSPLRTKARVSIRSALRLPAAGTLEGGEDEDLTQGDEP